MAQITLLLLFSRVLDVVLDSIELFEGGAGAADGGGGGCSSEERYEGDCFVGVSHCVRRISCLLVVVVEMMLHSIANAIYEMPMGSDEFVDPI